MTVTPSRPEIACVAADQPVYVVGDIHGCADELQALLGALEINAETTVVLVGDYIDRGPEARQVVEIVLELFDRCRLIPLLGNHEAMFLGFLENPQSPNGALFVLNGGGATLASYANETGQYALPRSHLTLLHQLKLWFETPEWFVVHAGVPSLPLDQLDPARDWDTLLCTRDMRKSTYAWSKLVVHGHTPGLQVHFDGRKINVDTGCVFGNRLSAVELRSQQVISVPRGTGPGPRLLRDGSSRRSAVRFQGSARVRVFHKAVVYELETVNYSQTGILVRWRGEGPEPLFLPDQLVGGVVGVGSPSALAFTAVVVRREASHNGLVFGLRLLPPGGSSEITQLARGLAEAEADREAAQWADLLGQPGPNDP